MTLRPRRHKFNAKPTIVDNVRFHSKREAERYKTLRLLQAAGKIKDLTLQKRYELTVHGDVICAYVADFVYFENGQVVVEDTKGFRTPEYKIKKRLFEALFGVKIRES